MSSGVNPVGVPTVAGLLYGPRAGSGKRYLCSNHHRGARRGGGHKHEWHPVNVPPFVEYRLFCRADDKDWFDSDGHYWGFGNYQGKMILGTNKERLCKFPLPSNATDAWHGYPVSPMQEGDKDAPPDEFIEEWIAKNFISKVFGRRIQRRKV
jgi:hypothetical protein